MKHKKKASLKNTDIVITRFAHVRTKERIKKALLDDLTLSLEKSSPLVAKAVVDELNKASWPAMEVLLDQVEDVGLLMDEAESRLANMDWQMESRARKKRSEENLKKLREKAKAAKEKAAKKPKKKVAEKKASKTAAKSIVKKAPAKLTVKKPEKLRALTKAANQTLAKIANGDPGYKIHDRTKRTLFDRGLIEGELTPGSRAGPQKVTQKGRDYLQKKGLLPKAKPANGEVRA